MRVCVCVCAILRIFYKTLIINLFETKISFLTTAQQHFIGQQKYTFCQKF